MGVITPPASLPTAGGAVWACHQVTDRRQALPIARSCPGGRGWPGISPGRALLAGAAAGRVGGGGVRDSYPVRAPVTANRSTAATWPPVCTTMVITWPDAAWNGTLNDQGLAWPPAG